MDQELRSKGQSSRQAQKRGAKKRVRRALRIGGLGLCLIGSTAWADDSVTTNAYYRTGVNFSKGSTKGTCFRMTGPIIPRYGNECDHYGELMIHKAYKADDIQYRAHLNLAFSADGNDTWEPTYDSSTKDADLTLSYREAWVEAAGVFGGNSSVWVGKRFYDRWYLEMWDFFITNHNGSGFGTENLDLGLGKLNAALLRHYQNGSRQPVHLAADVQWHDLEALGGKWAFRYQFSQKGSKPNADTENEWYAIDGHAINVRYALPLSNASYQTYLQYGTGLHGGRPDGSGGQTGSTFNAFSSSSLAKADPNGDAINKAWKKSSTLRWTNDLLLFPESPSFNLNLGLSYTLVDFGGALGADGEEADNRSTLAVGAHPTYYLSKIWAVDADIFYANIDKGLPLVSAAPTPASNESIERSMQKLTLGLVLRPGIGQGLKPQIRFYVTEVSWNSAQKGDLLITEGNPVYADSTRGTTYGVQGEVWW